MLAKVKLDFVTELNVVRYKPHFICQVEFQKESRHEKMIVTTVIFVLASYPIGVILRYLFQSDRFVF